MNLIEKSALVAKIKALVSSVETSQKAGMTKKRDADKKIFLFKSVLSLIDTLEVKEVQEEPVSEDFEEASNNALNKVLNTHEIVNIKSCLEMFKYGAQWKEKEQFEKNRLAACDAQTKEEAEKDLELTWKDIHAIAIIEDKLIHELCLNDQTLPHTQEFYEEVLKRFKAKKEKSC